MTLMLLERTRALALTSLVALTACGSDSALVSRDLTPPIGRLMSHDGKQVHVHVSGPEDAPTVILLHGASGNLRDFNFDLGPRLAERYRVIAFDRPGLGYSDALHSRGASPREQARHLAAITDQLGVERAVVVGHSFGASVAMAWALERPDMTAAVVSLAGAVNPWPGGLGAYYVLTGSWLGGWTVVPLITLLASESVAENSVRGIFSPDALPEGYLDYIGTDLTLRGSVLRANARQVTALKPHVTEMSALYPTLDIPVEIVHGSADDTVPMQIHSEPLSRAVPGAHLVVLDGVGHMPHHARPEAAVAAIDRAASRAGLHQSEQSR